MVTKKSKSSVITYKIDTKTERKLRDAIRAKNKEGFEEILDPVEANYHTTNLLRKIVSDLDKKVKIEWGKYFLEKDQKILRVVGILLIHEMELWKSEERYVHNMLDVYCKDEDWNVRQITVDILSEMLSTESGNGYQFFKESVKSEDPHRRRLALLTAKKIAQSSYFEDDLKQSVLKDIKPLLVENDPYVITVTAETFNEGFMKYCTDMTLNWIDENIDEIENPKAKSIILRMIGTKYVENQLDEALSIIDKFLLDDDPKVKKARSAALHNLSKHFEHKISSFLEERMHIKQAVDHWADLEAVGSLNTLDF